MQKTQFVAAASALFLAASGLSHAQGAGGSSGGGVPSGAIGEVASPQTVGRTVYDRAGKAVGQVTAVNGDSVTLAVDRSLGLGARQVTLPASQINPGSTGDQRLTTALSPAELQEMPEADPK